MFPHRFWDLSERVKRHLPSFKALNQGAEFFQYLMETYFEPGKLKNLDVRSIIDAIKNLESDALGILADAGSGKRNPLKYNFMPVETD